jgi:hypothetical protein
VKGSGPRRGRKANNAQGFKFLESVFGTEELLRRKAANTSKNGWAFSVNEVGCVMMRSGP